jgi:hypothetical protein
MDVRADARADLQVELDGKGLDCNADKDRGPNGVRRHGLRLVRRIETWMFKRTPEWNIRVEFRELVAWIDTEL